MGIGGKYVVISGNAISGVCLGIGATPCFISGNTFTDFLSPFWLNSDDSIFTKNAITDVAYGLGAEGSNNVIFANQITSCNEPFGDPIKHFPVTNAKTNESNLFYGNNIVGCSCPSADYTPIELTS